jgi:hypothetical protein
MEVCTPSRPTLSPTSLLTITTSSREGDLEDHAVKSRDAQDMEAWWKIHIEIDISVV